MTNPPLITKRQTLGQLLVCLGCCCGRTDKGIAPVPIDWLKAKWKERKLLRSIQLTISGCLGPCDLANVVCVVTPDQTIWLGGLTTHQQFEGLLDWATESAAVGQLKPLPDSFAAHRFDRFQTQDECHECLTGVA